jgi:hypothetical protein
MSFITFIQSVQYRSQVGRLAVDSCQGWAISIYSTGSRPSLVHIQCVPGTLSQEDDWLDHEADHSLLCGANVDSGGAIILFPTSSRYGACLSTGTNTVFAVMKWICSLCGGGNTANIDRNMGNIGQVSCTPAYNLTGTCTGKFSAHKFAVLMVMFCDFLWSV